MPGLDPALRALRKLASGTGVWGAYLVLLPLAVVLRVGVLSPHLNPCFDCVYYSILYSQRYAYRRIATESKSWKMDLFSWTRHDIMQPKRL